jgi:hypothetical protein
MSKTEQLLLRMFMAGGVAGIGLGASAGVGSVLGVEEHAVFLGFLGIAVVLVGVGIFWGSRVLKAAAARHEGGE